MQDNIPRLDLTHAAVYVSAVLGTLGREQHLTERIGTRYTIGPTLNVGFLHPIAASSGRMGLADAEPCAAARCTGDVVEFRLTDLDQCAPPPWLIDHPAVHLVPAYREPVTIRRPGHKEVRPCHGANAKHLLRPTIGNDAIADVDLGEFPHLMIPIGLIVRMRTKVGLLLSSVGSTGEARDISRLTPTHGNIAALPAFLPEPRVIPRRNFPIPHLSVFRLGFLPLLTQGGVVKVQLRGVVLLLQLLTDSRRAPGQHLRNSGRGHRARAFP